MQKMDVEAAERRLEIGGRDRVTEARVTEQVFVGTPPAPLNAVGWRRQVYWKFGSWEGTPEVIPGVRAVFVEVEDGVVVPWVGREEGG